EIVSGYSNGDEENLSYELDSTGTAKHVEAVRIVFDDTVISYRVILEIFFKTFDLTEKGGQFGDRGPQSMPAIFDHNVEQKEMAETVNNELEEKKVFNAPIITPVLPYKNFYPAEEEHQDFYKKNAGHYKAYYKGSGRQGFIENTWGEQ